MKSPRDLVVKTRLNADEFLFVDKACSVVEISHSKLLRDLALEWAARQLNRRQNELALEGAMAGLERALLPPNSRINFGVAPVHPRI